jgi:hypothetical protein
MWRKYPSKSALLPHDCDGRHSVGIGNTGTIEQFYVGGRTMITVPELSAEALGSFLTSHLGRRFSSTEAELTELVPSVARLALECIGNSDALYHNVEHTMLVTLVGYDIMKGRALLTPTCFTTLAMCGAFWRETVPTGMSSMGKDAAPSFRVAPPMRPC